MRRYLVLFVLALFFAACGGSDGRQSANDAAMGDGALGGDAASCAGPDTDGDATPDSCDNCPNVANPDQADTHGYSAASMQFPASPESTDGTIAEITGGTPDEDISDPLPIGFTFNFFGRAQTEFFTTTNGFIAFRDANGAAPANSNVNQSLPDVAAPNNVIAAAWADLTALSSNGITFATRGVTPSRYLVVSFTDVAFVNDNNITLAFQVILREGSDVIEIHTTAQPTPLSSETYTRGIEDALGKISASLPGQNHASFSLTNAAARYTTKSAPDGIGDACSNAIVNL
jgi:hypothetical protein